ncbi:MAG: endonuclease MutS2 [Thermovirgaceae bacterium]
MKTDARTLDAIEMGKILVLFERSCRSDLGRRILAQTGPLERIEEVLRRQNLQRAYNRYRDTRGDLPWDDRAKPVGPLLNEAKRTGLLTGEEILSVRVLLGICLRLKSLASEVKEDFPEFLDLTKKLRDFKDLFEDLQVVADDGRLYDGASARLRELRNALRVVTSSARRKAQSLMESQSFSPMLQDRALHFRDGRITFLVRLEDMSRFDGMAVDRSGTGNSVYMEPRGLIELNNRTVLLHRDVEKEENRILRDLTGKILDRHGALLEAERVLGELDLLYAASSLQKEKSWVLPEMDGRSRFSLRHAVNPLLGDDCVPVDIHCGDRFRQLVITGPNTGGKTVVLKTTAAAVYLAWCGLPAPVGEGSVVGDIDWMSADIGDEQSIEQSLSTFSAHVLNIIEMLERAGHKSLLLLDELGAGTDPQEGAALGVAILESLNERGSLVLATTHHNAIKRYALTRSGVETAGMEFDDEKLAPTYRLRMGIPGESNALRIAGRLGMSGEIIEKAKEVLHEGHADAERLLEELLRKQQHLEDEEERLYQERREVAGLKETLLNQRRSIESKREKILEDAERKARAVLEESEKKAKAMLRKMERADVPFGREQQEIAEMKKSLRKREEEREDRRLDREKTPGDWEPARGETVRIAGTSTRGTIEALDGKKALLLSGSMKFEVPVKKLVPDDGNKLQEEPLPVKKSLSPPGHVPSSIMVRGMTVDEALPEVERYLDRAFRAGYGEVTVIHGRGEGILRREVQALCKTLPFVVDYRLGGPGEGGYGVTIVRFRQ